VANDPVAIGMLVNHYHHGLNGFFQQDHANAIELFTKSVDLGYSKAHSKLGIIYKKVENMKKAKFHFEVAAMAGHDGARCNRKHGV
jgi:TPR repeat protein